MPILLCWRECALTRLVSSCRLDLLAKTLSKDAKRRLNFICLVCLCLRNQQTSSHGATELRWIALVSWVALGLGLDRATERLHGRNSAFSVLEINAYSTTCTVNQRAVQQSIDIAFPRGPQQQTRCTSRLRRKMGQTDGQTPYRYTDPVAYFARSVNKQNRVNASDDKRCYKSDERRESNKRNKWNHCNNTFWQQTWQSHSNSALRAHRNAEDIINCWFYYTCNTL